MNNGGDLVSKRTKVTIGMPTYLRPEGLRRIIPVLVRQASELTEADVTIVVVDNSAEGGAFAVLRPWLGDGLRYEHEPTPGIAAARNRALDAAAGSDVLICCDDDEVPADGWLRSIVSAWTTWRCAAVTGPVETIFDGAADEWVQSSGMFVTARRKTGCLVPGADSGNLLLDLEQLGRMGLRFDERFGLSGGSDTMLAHSIRERAGEVRWCQEALMREVVPQQRLRRSWVINRTVRTSNTWSRMRLALTTRPAERLRTRVELSARGGYRLLRGTARVCRGQIVDDVVDQALGSVDVASGRGLLLGAFGGTRFEYSR